MDDTIPVRGDKDEVFLNYRFDENRWKVLYLLQKRYISNVLSGTVFNNYIEVVLNERSKLFLMLFFFLLPTIDGKENINDHRVNFRSYPVEILYDIFDELCSLGYKFNPTDLKIPPGKKMLGRSLWRQ